MADPRFDKPVLLESLPGGVWRIYGGFFYHTSVAQTKVIAVPEGFETDFASVPRLFWNIFPPTGNYRNAAVVHDYCYRTRGVCTKAEADNIFYEAMEYLGVGWWTRHILYAAVHRFGGSSFKGGF